MKEAELIRDGSVCEGDFMEGIDTVAEMHVRAGEREACRFFPHECPMLDFRQGPSCIQRYGSEVAKNVVKSGTSVDEELKDFAAEVPMPANGFFDPTVEEPRDATLDREEAVERVGAAASKILGIVEIDSGSVNKEFRTQPDKDLLQEHGVLEASVFDEDNSTWIHSCGTTIATAETKHPVHLKMMPLAGPGRVVTKQKPYCPSCEDEPNPNGAPVYVEDEEEDEMAKLRELRNRLGGL